MIALAGVVLSSRTLIMRTTLRLIRADMSEPTPDQETETETTATQDDSKADVIAIAVIFGAAVLMAAHFISGFTIDF